MKRQINNSGFSTPDKLGQVLSFKICPHQIAFLFNVIIYFLPVLFIPFATFGHSLPTKEYALIIKEYPFAQKVYPLIIKEYPFAIKGSPIIIKEYPLAQKEYPLLIKEYPFAAKECPFTTKGDTYYRI